MQIGAPVLGHAGGLGVEFVGTDQLAALVDEHARHLNLGLQLGQRVARVLESAHRLAENLALLHVGHGLVDGRLRGGHGGDGDLQALPGQLLHQADEAAVFQRFAAEQVLGRHAHVVEEQLGGVLRAQAQFLEPLAHREARHAALHQHQARALAAGGGVGLGHDDDQVGMPAVGDEGLAAVEQVAAVALLDRGGLDALQVGSGGRLAHRDRADQLAGGQLRQVLLLLRLGAVVQDVGRNDLAVQAVADAGDAGARKLLELDHRIKLVGVGAAIGLGHGGTQETVLAGLVPDRAVHVALLFPGVVEGRDLFFDEAAEAVAEGLVVGVEQGAFDHDETPGTMKRDKKER